ncbi:DUF1206 domain-containing protein [Alsobacter soli]|nr:DUF1206 domain-containing protein [Alsobacter soli]
MARAGYVARGVVFILVGGLATLAGLGNGSRAPDSHGALQTLLAQPFGAVLLAALALGMLAFAAWRVAQAILDADHLGSSGKALARRLGYGVGAVVNGGVAASAASLIFTYSARSGEQSAHDWTGYVLSLPFGRALVGLIGAGVVVAGIGAGWKAWTAKFTEHLSLDQKARTWVLPLGRIGYAARAVVFVLIGGFLVAAAVHANAREARGLAGALAELQAQTYGSALLLLTALGLFAFGVFQLAAARFRRIDAPKLGEAGDRLKQQARQALG